MPFTDRRGRQWTVVEYRTVNGKRKRVPIAHVPLSDARIEGRAFIPDGWDGEVLVYRMDAVSYRGIDQKTLQGQLDGAHRADATPRERMGPRRDR